MTPVEELFVEAAYQIALEYWSKPEVVQRYVEIGRELPEISRSDFTEKYGSPNWSEVTESLGESSFTFIHEGKSHTVTYIDQKGGEGQGDKFYYVYDLDGTNYMLEAYYASWEGIQWEDAELYPVQAKVIKKTIWVKA